MIGTPAACIAWRARVFEPISSIAAGGGPIHDEPARLDRARERGVLGQEPVARDGPPPRPTGRRPRAASRRRGSSRPRSARRARRPRRRRRTCRRVAVGIGVDGDRADAQLAQGAEDPEGDLAPVRDQDFGEHTSVFSLTDELRRSADRRPRGLGADRRRAFRDPLPRPRLLGDRRLLRRDGDRLVRRPDRAPHRPHLVRSARCSTRSPTSCS